MMVLSAQQVGDLHGDGVLGAVELAGQAVPALVVAHVGLAGLGADRQAVDRAGVDADVAALDAPVLVDDHRDVEAAGALGGRARAPLRVLAPLVIAHALFSSTRRWW